MVFVHAHPDDEVSLNAGTMARAAAEGHRVATVFATNGDHGESPENLAAGESVTDRRRREAEASARVLGVLRIHWLGFRDSGMTGWSQNDDPASLLRADLDDAAKRLALILERERAEVVVGYDWHGGYGHPDHVKVHHVVRRAVQLIDGERPHLVESTFNRDLVRRVHVAFLEAGGAGAWDPDEPMDDGNPLGEPESAITLQVDVRDFLGQKRAAMECHRSQATDIESFLALPPAVFEDIFGLEHFIVPGDRTGMRRGWILESP